MIANREWVFHVKQIAQVKTPVAKKVYLKPQENGKYQNHFNKQFLMIDRQG